MFSQKKIAERQVVTEKKLKTTKNISFKSKEEIFIIQPKVR